MSTLHYVTNNGERTGRVSHFQTVKSNAITVCARKNDKAEKLNIKTRYSVESCNSEGIESKEIR